MSRLGPNQLTARKVDALKEGVHSDGGNLADRQGRLAAMVDPLHKPDQR